MSEQPGEYRAQHPIPDWLRTLLDLQNDVVYVIECLADDYTGEAKSGLRDVYQYLDTHPLPPSFNAALREQLERADAALRGNRDIRMASRVLQTLRRRLANQVALGCGLPAPYTGSYYPVFMPEDQADG